MKIRNEWMSDYNYFGEDYPNNILLDDAKVRFELQKQSLEGRDASIDGITEKIVVQNHTNPLNQARYDKKLSFNIDSNVHTGSVIEFDNKKWLVVSKIFDKYAYKVGSVLECIHTLTFYKEGITNSPTEIPYVVFDKTALTRMGTETGKYLEIPYSRMMIMLPNTDITTHILRNDKFNLYSKDDIVDTYEVIDINRVRVNGLIILELEYAISEQPPLPTPEPELPNELTAKIINPQTSIAKNQSASYVGKFYLEQEEINTELATFYLTDIDGNTTSLATIAEQNTNGTCVIKANGNVGYITLWMKNQDGSVVSDGVKITISHF